MACSRGFVPLLSRPAIAPLRRPLHPLSRSRPFTCSASRHAAAARPNAKPRQPQPQPQPQPQSQSRPASSPKPRIPTPGPVALSPTTLNNPVLLQIARSQSPTLLYESGSHFWMKFASWSTAFACYSAAGINLYLAFGPPSADAGVTASWAPSLVWVQTAVAVALGGMGSFFLLGGANIIKTVRALPASSLPKDHAGLRSALPAGSNARLTPILLEVSVKPLMPFARRPTIMHATPERVTLAQRLYRGTPAGDVERSRRMKDEAARKAQWEEDKKTLMTLPFRHAWRGAVAAWTGVRRALTGGGFAKMTVGDRKCKLDVARGWALEDGHALESVVGNIQTPQRSRKPRKS